MREYRSTDNKAATISKHPCGVLVEVEGKMRVCPDTAKAVEWLATEYSVGWYRVNRYR